MVLESLPTQKASIQIQLSQLEGSQRSQRDNFLLTQAFMRRKLNAVASPVFKLPLEILTMIFLYAVLPPPRASPLDNWIPSSTPTRDLVDIFFSITLAAVCSSWRSVALSTPRLWVYFEFPETLWTRECVPRHLLSLYLHNSKHLPIHLSLSFSAKEGCKTPYNSLFHPSLDHALISNASRVYSLSLYNPPLRWLEQLGKMPFIADLSMQWPLYIPETHDRLQIHRCHLLSRLSLRNVTTARSGRVLYQAPPSLTVLDLSGISIDVCIKMMLRCPKLVEAYIDDPHNEWDDEALQGEILQTWFPEPVVFEHLTIFLWCHCYYEWSDAFLQRMKTPRLHTLKLTTTDGELIVGDAALPGHTLFIAQLPMTLKTFEIEGIWSTSISTLGRLLDSRSSVEHLIMSQCSWMVLSDIFEALRKLGKAFEPDHLPRLKSLSIRCRAGDEEDEELGNGHISTLIESLERRLGPSGQFKLELSGFGVDWTPVAQRRLRKLVEKGVQLEVIEDSERVNWLQPL